MGITNFSDSLFIKKNLCIPIKFDCILVDCNLYYSYFLQNIYYYTKRVKLELEKKPIQSIQNNYFNDIEIEEELSHSEVFARYLVSRVLPCCSEICQVELIFDSIYARKLIKWHTCLKRNYDGFRDLDLKIFLSLLPKNFTVKRADFDADGEIYKLVVNKIFSSNCNNTQCVSFEDEKLLVSKFCIFTGDSDYLCFFPNSIDCCVFHINELPIGNNHLDDQNELAFLFVFRNYKLLNDFEIDPSTALFSICTKNSPEIILKNESFMKKRKLSNSRNEVCSARKLSNRANNAEFFNYDIAKNFYEINCYTNFFIKIIGMMSSNDYITASFLDREILFDVIQSTYFKTGSNYLNNLNSFKTLATLYVGEYIKKNRYKKELLTNSLRFLNRHGNHFIVYDLNAKMIEEDGYNDKIQKLFFEIICSLDSGRINEEEITFKSLPKSKETVLLRDLLKEFLENSSKDTNSFRRKYEILIFSTSCSILLLANFLLATFFITVNISKNRLKAHLLYLAHIVFGTEYKIDAKFKKHKINFLKFLFEYFELTPTFNIKIFKFKKANKTKFVYNVV